MRTQIVLLFMCFTCGVQAQSGHEWERYLNEVMTAEDAGSAAWEDTYDLLCELEQHPLDINQATREQLEQLPFLSAQQVEEIVEYLYRYGPMKSLAELRMIRSLDDSRRRLLTYFIYVDESGSANPRQHDGGRQHDYLHHALMATGRIPFYEAADFCSAGYKAGWLGQSEENDLQWRNVYSNDGGEYQLTIGYISGENRNITVSVNGEKAATISANSGGWQKVGTKTLTIQLQKGRNTIRLSNATNWLPDIDYIELFSTASSAIRPVAMQQQDDAAIYDLSGRKVANPHKGIYINNHRKVMK